LRDISEKKKAQDALKRRERQLNEAQHVAKLASYELNHETGEMEWSDSARSIFGTEDEKDIATMNAIWKRIHPDDVSRVMELRKQMDQSGTTPLLEFRIVTPAGDTKHLVAKRVNARTGKEDERLFGTVQDVTEQKIVERKILEAVIDTEEKERTRIAQELHDGVCQDIAAARLTLDMAHRMASEDPLLVASQLFQQSKEGLLTALQHTRKVSHELLPKNIKEEGLTKSIGNLVNKLNGIDHANYSLTVNGQVTEPDPLIAMNVYRIAQEFIRNSQKHSGADEVNVTLDFQEHQLNVALRDNGRGFEAEKLEKKGIGFINMAKRVESVGGTMNLHSKPDQGTLLHLIIPLQ
jgi:signal transduction histidine kinase